MSTALQRIRRSLSLRNDRDWEDDLDWPAFEALTLAESVLLRSDLEQSVQNGDHRAALGLKLLGSADSLFFLLSQAKDNNTTPAVRLACIDALEGLRDSDFLVALLEEHNVINTASWAVRFGCLMWLQAQTSSKTVPLLLKSLRNDHGPIRARASEMLIQHMGISGEKGSRLNNLTLRLALNLSGAWSLAADDFDTLFQLWKDKAPLDGWLCGPTAPDNSPAKSAVVASFQDHSYSSTDFNAMEAVDRDSFSFIFHQQLETQTPLSPMRLSKLGIPGAHKALLEMLPKASGDFQFEVLEVLWKHYQDPQAEITLKEYSADPALGWRAKEILAP